MPEMNLIELLRQARNSSQNAMRILLTAHGDLNVAIEAINDGGCLQIHHKTLE
tara:strand:- start:282 stop:440 length:159 start_codon:yes stop_codon:yes gene_type:complete